MTWMFSLFLLLCLILREPCRIVKICNHFIWRILVIFLSIGSSVSQIGKSIINTLVPLLQILRCNTYANLHAAYEKAGLTDSEVEQLLQLNIPDNAYFNAKGIYNYHGGSSVVFDDENVLNWVLAQRKSTGKGDSNEKDETTSNGGHGGSAGDRNNSDGPGGRGYL